MLEVVAGIHDNGSGSPRASDKVQAPAWRHRCRRKARSPCRRCQPRSSEKILIFRPQQRGRRCRGSFHSNPRKCTAGCPSAPCPMTSDAAAAISSATAISVTRNLRPNRSGTPIKLRTTGNPAAPNATPTTPKRQGRPKLSLIMTPRSTPNSRSSRAFNPAADTSGSRGKSQGLVAALTGNVGLVDARVGHNEPEPMHNDQHVPFLPDDLR